MQDPTRDHKPQRTILVTLALGAMLLLLPGSGVAGAAAGSRSGETKPARPARLAIAPPTPAQVYRWAEDVRSSRAFRTATAGDRQIYKRPGRTKRRPAPRPLGSGPDVVREASALIDQVLATGGRMTPAQAKRYDARMRSLLRRLESRPIGTPGSTGDGPASCMKECDEAYPGWGGGNGWNRFWCKAACLKVSIGKGGASVGD